MASIEYRHPSEADVEAITEVINQSQREQPLHRDETVEEVRLWTFGEDDYDPRGFLVAIIDGQIVGYGGSHVQTARIEAGMNDAYVTVEVVPEHRGKGIEQHLLGFGIEYLRSRGVGTAQRWNIGMEGWRHDLSREFGFEDVRHGYMMVWEKNGEPVVVSSPDGIILKQQMFKEASDDEIRLFVENFNDTFAEHYNFSPAPVEKFIKYRDNEEEIGRMAFAMKGEEIVGVTLCEESTLYNKQNNESTGWVNILGVKKAHRRSGIGRALLSDAVKWVYDRGMDTIYLGMDAENKKALDLYTSLGFKVHTESVTYKLKLG